MKRQRIIEIGIILFLGLTPLLWFHGSEVILGHDAGLPLSPFSHFLDRLYAWTYRFGFGVDQSYALPGFFIHGLEAIITSFGASLQLQQKIEFIFWFTLPGITMYFLASSIAERYRLRFFTLPVVALYMFNHFLLQGWFIAERTKFSLYAALPLLLLFLLDWQDKKRGTIVTSIYISLTFFFLNGSGSLPLFGGILLLLTVYVFFFFLFSISKERIIQLVKLIGLVILFSLLLHAYWLLPFIYFLSHAFDDTVQAAGGVGGIVGWLSYISQNSSFINLLRLQGIPEWYQNPSHPYAFVYLTNPALVFTSVIIPILAFSPLRLVKERPLRKLVYFFAVLALFSMIFIAGSHPPFGAVYLLMVKIIPGFIAFRTPFYKFSPALWFAFSVLIGFTIHYALEYVSKMNKKIAYGCYGGVVLLIILYSYPFLTGDFFNYVVGERTMKVQVPQYVYDFRTFSETSDRKDMKTLVLPPPSTSMNVDAYTWGYWSLSPLPSLLTNAPLVTISAYMPEDVKKLVYQLAYKLKKNDPTWKDLAEALGISSVLVRRDFAWNLSGSPTDNPAIYSQVLQNSEGTRLIKTFGEWEVYDVSDSRSKVTIYPTLEYIQGNTEDISAVSASPLFDKNSGLYVSGQSSDSQEKIFAAAKRIYVVPHCIMCNLVFTPINEDLYIPTFTPDSFLYPYLSRKQQKTEQSLLSPEQKVEYYLEQSLKDEKGVEKVIIEKKPVDAIQLTFRKYYATMRKLEESLISLLDENNINHNTTILNTHNSLRIQRKNIIDNFSKTVPDLDPQTFNDFFALFDRLYLLTRDKAWYTSTLLEKKYLFDVPKDGKYTLYLNKQTLSDPDTTRSAINYIIDERSYQTNSQEIEGWYQSSPMSLRKGVHKLQIEDAPLKNLFSSSSATMTLEGSSSESSCYISQVFPADSGDYFNLSFQYRQVTGDGQFFYTVLQKNETIPLLSERGANLKRIADWKDESYTYVANNDDGIRFVICSRIQDSTFSQKSTIEVRDIGLYKITTPEVVLATDSSGTQMAKEVSRPLSTNTNTTVTLSTDRTLKNKVVALNTTANDEWQLSGSTANKFVVNGYANGWLIEDDTQEVTMKYSPQRLVFIGFIITGITFSFMVLWLLYRKLVRNEK